MPTAPLRPPRPGAVLVSGGAGFIGERVARLLVDVGRRVVVADDLSASTPLRAARLAAAGARVARVDVGAPGAFARLFRDHGPFGTLLHLAARVGVRRVLADPEACRRETRAATRGLIEALDGLHPAQRPRVLAASTSEVYREQRGPLGEGSALRSIHGQGRWAYAAAKLEAERALDAAHDAAGDAAGDAADDAARQGSALAPRPLHLRLFNVVGPGQDPDSGMVLARFAAQAAAGEPITVHGDGHQVRTFAHVDDVAAALARLCSEPFDVAGPLNLGGLARIEIAHLAHLVAREARDVFGRRVEIVSVDPRRTLSVAFEEVQRREPDLARATSLGLLPSTRSAQELVRDVVASAFATPRAVPCGSRAS